MDVDELENATTPTPKQAAGLTGTFRRSLRRNDRSQARRCSLPGLGIRSHFDVRLRSTLRLHGGTAGTAESACRPALSRFIVQFDSRLAIARRACDFPITSSLRACSKVLYDRCWCQCLATHRHGTAKRWVLSRGSASASNHCHHKQRSLSSRWLFSSAWVALPLFFSFAFCTPP